MTQTVKAALQRSFERLEVSIPFTLFIGGIAGLFVWPVGVGVNAIAQELLVYNYTQPINPLKWPEAHLPKSFLESTPAWVYMVILMCFTATLAFVPFSMILALCLYGTSRKVVGWTLALGTMGWMMHCGFSILSIWAYTSNKVNLLIAYSAYAGIPLVFCPIILYIPARMEGASHFEFVYPFLLTAHVVVLTLTLLFVIFPLYFTSGFMTSLLTRTVGFTVIKSINLTLALWITSKFSRANPDSLHVFPSCISIAMSVTGRFLQINTANTALVLSTGLVSVLLDALEMRAHMNMKHGFLSRLFFWSVNSAHSLANSSLDLLPSDEKVFFTPTAPSTNLTHNTFASRAMVNMPIMAAKQQALSRMSLSSSRSTTGGIDRETLNLADTEGSQNIDNNPTASTCQFEVPNDSEKRNDDAPQFSHITLARLSTSSDVSRLNKPESGHSDDGQVRISGSRDSLTTQFNDVADDCLVASTSLCAHDENDKEIKTSDLNGQCIEGDNQALAINNNFSENITDSNTDNWNDPNMSLPPLLFQYSQFTKLSRLAALQHQRQIFSNLITCTSMAEGASAISMTVFVLVTRVNAGSHTAAPLTPRIALINCCILLVCELILTNLLVLLLNEYTAYRNPHCVHLYSEWAKRKKSIDLIASVVICVFSVEFCVIFSNNLCVRSFEGDAVLSHC
eukprot:c2872_g1_i1.p1 GENE.c2872_g1_i1~~c2872_g1_i1.p1  ORF type:complete len:680 (+),score=124.89 c2872_g1_i1:173-2212(+)